MDLHICRKSIKTNMDMIHTKCRMVLTLDGVRKMEEEEGKKEMEY